MSEERSMIIAPITSRSEPCKTCPRNNGEFTDIDCLECWRNPLMSDNSTLEEAED